MPQVPVYDSPQVSQAQAPAVRQDLGEGLNAVARQMEYGSNQQNQIGRDFQGMGAELSKIQTDEILQQNQYRVKDALNKMQDASLKMQLGDPNDPDEKGFKSQLGSAALQPDPSSGKSMAQLYQEKWQQKQQDIIDSLGNDAQKQTFAAYAAHLQNQFNGEMAQHIFQQNTVFQNATDDKTMDNGMKQFLANYKTMTFNNDGTMRFAGDAEQGLQQLVAGATAKLTRMGMTGDVLASKVQELVGSAYSQAAQAAMVDNLPNVARSIVNSGVQGGLMKESDREQIENHLMPIEMANAANDVVTKMTQSITDPITGALKVNNSGDLLNMGKAAAEQAATLYLQNHPADQVGANKVRQETLSQWHSQVMAPAVEKQEEMHYGLTAAVDMHNITSLKQLLSDPQLAQQYQQLDPKFREVIDGHIMTLGREQRAEDRADRADRRAAKSDALALKKEQSSQLADSMLGLAITNPDQFISTDPSSYSGKMMPSDAMRVLSVQRQMKDKNDTTVGAHISKDDVMALGTMLKAGGIDPSAKKGTAAETKYQTFVGQLDGDVRNFQAQVKRKASQDEIANLARERMTVSEVPTFGGIMTSDKNTWELSDEELLNAHPKLSPTQTSVLTGAFTKAYGYAPSQDDLRDFYYMGSVKKGDSGWVSVMNNKFKNAKQKPSNNIPE